MSKQGKKGGKAKGKNKLRGTKEYYRDLAQKSHESRRRNKTAQI